MPILNSVRRMGGETPGCSLAMTCFFLVFVAIGVQSLRVGNWLGLIFLLFGAPLALGSALGAIGYGRFGKAVGEIAEVEVAPGQDVHFTFRQRIRPGVVEGVRVFLVFREHVTDTSGSDAKTEDMDRLVAEFTDCRDEDVPANEVAANAVFRIPSRDMGLRYTEENRQRHTVETSWVIKVRLESGRARSGVMWKEYGVPVRAAIAPSLSPSDSDRVEASVDLFLVDVQPSSLIAVTRAMSAILPHLDSGQIGTLYFARRTLLLERVSTAEAERARQALEAAGAIVETRPAIDAHNPLLENAELQDPGMARVRVPR